MESCFFCVAFHFFTICFAAFQPADVGILRHIANRPFEIDGWTGYFHRSGQ